MLVITVLLLEHGCTSAGQSNAKACSGLAEIRHSHVLIGTHVFGTEQLMLLQTMEVSSWCAV